MGKPRRPTSTLHTCLVVFLTMNPLHNTERNKVGRSNYFRASGFQASGLGSEACGFKLSLCCGRAAHGIFIPQLTFLWDRVPKAILYGYWPG